MTKVTIFQGRKEDILRQLGITHHPGYHGAFTRNEVLGAWRNGTVVVKAKKEPSDTTPLGTEGVVLGSIFDSKISPYVMYFIEWANQPRVAVSVIGWKIMAKGK